MGQSAHQHPRQLPLDPMASDKVASYDWVRPEADYVRREVMVPMRVGPSCSPWS